MRTAACPKGFGAHPHLGQSCVGVGGNRKNALLSRNRHMYNGGVRYFIPFCCEQSCKKPFYTSHTDKPLTERSWMKKKQG